MKRLLSNNWQLGLINKDKENIFLGKLRRIVDSFDKNTAISLAKVISLNGNLFPQKSIDESVFGQEPFAQACILIRNCLEQVKDTKHRDKVALEIVKIVTPLDFAGEYFRWNCNFRDSEGNIKEVFVSEECENKMLSYLVSVIKDEVKQEPLEKRYPQKSSQLYYDWYHKDLKSLKNYLKKRFKKNPREVEDFIYSFRQQSYETNSVVKSFGFDFIISAFEKSNPKLAKTEDEDNEFWDYDEVQDKEKFFRNFLKIYRTNRENS